MTMIPGPEKAYCRGLTALKEKDYAAADREFDACGAAYGKSGGFRIMAVATKLLARVQREKMMILKTTHAIEEAVSHGKETIVCRQGEQEETR
jgi:hypothetical protein